MSQQTNLNVAPYFDDFNSSDSYHRVLFKPGYPVQARELTTLQSILQNQIEKFGTNIFKEGSVVIPGSVSYKNDLSAVILNNSFQGLSSEIFLPSLVGKRIKGQTSGVTAVVKSYLSNFSGVVENTTIFVKYLGSNSENNSNELFLDGENLLVDEQILPSQDRSENSSIPQLGTAFATTVSKNSTSVGSAVYLDSGVYFLRGHFVEVGPDVLYLNPYSNNVSCKVGFRIFERFVTSYEDEKLNDNSQGFFNYAAPGADRLKITATLDKIDIDSNETNNFVELFEVRNGVLISIKNTPEYNILQQEFARRTFDESGNYYVNSPIITVKESLNDNKGNGGIFEEDTLTYNNNVPSEDLGTYVISPLKAYIRGFEVETISPTFLDFKKTRETKTLENQSINYFTGPTLTLNRVYGTPLIGIGNTYTLSLRDSRVGISQTTPSGNEIGLARVYDYALESGSYNTSNSNLNQWDICLYDIQTYTTIKLNEPITLSTPTHVKGRQSGATGYLRYDVSNSADIVLYNTNGKFSIGERLIFDGILNNRVTKEVRSYGIGDVKSLHGLVGTSYTFSADVVQDISYNIGRVTISPVSTTGISTVTSTEVSFVGIATTGNLVSFSGQSLTEKTFAKIDSVSDNSLIISGITTVSGICDGQLPASQLTATDFNILTTKLQSSSDNTLYTVLPKRNIQNVDLTKSNLVIRKQFDVTITNNTSSPISSAQDETFLPFDEERYVLIRENGVTENLSADKFVFTNGSKTLTMVGLSGNGNAKLIATLRKINVKSKIKVKNRAKSIIVNKSIYSSSGIGSTTLNDGLTYGNYPYGTRVQDEEICLLYPDVTKIYGVFESSDLSDPEIPSIISTNLDGQTNKTSDLLVGEEFVGQTSKSVGVLIEKNNDLKFSFVYLNSNSFIEGEKIIFKESGVSGNISSLDNGDKNITSSFRLESNQKDTIYDFSKITRNSDSREPVKKIKIVFEHASFSSDDIGDIITANSYEQFNYCDIGNIDNIKNSDLIDIRPRVSYFDVQENSRSPFEFLSRNFNSQENQTQNVLSSDESILIDYSFYLPRIDKILLSKDAVFQVSQGVASETPQIPQISEDSLDIATVAIPPYLCNINDVKITLNQYKRYRMSDIQKLENRIKNLEFYSTLSLLEVDTSNLLITDFSGLNRFKSGFFVDDFSTTKVQKKETIVKNSIDIQNSELRPTHYSTSVDLLLGTNSNIGIGTQTNLTVDARTDNDLIGSNVRKTGQLITLDYDEVDYINQPYSSQVINVSPYSLNYFSGSVEIYPSSDVWVDQVKVQPKTLNAEGNYTQTVLQASADPQTGFSPVTWNSWEDVWTGSSVSSTTRDVTEGYNIVRETLQTTTRTGTSTRQGTRRIVKEEFQNTSLGSQILSTEVVPFVRSRNIEFIGRRLKPFTQVYTFFDGVDVNNFVTPKLLEIRMTNGVFEVGETVIGTNLNMGVSSNRITFRVAQQNHKYGSYNSPSDVYTSNPYERNSEIPQNYSSTSTILNVDTYSLSYQAQGQFSGFISNGMVLKGQTSGAEAVVTNVRLITDSVGTIIGSFFIPNPNVDINPKFESGTKTFRLTSSSINSQIIGSLTTSAEEKYFSEGKINTTQENIIVTRNARIDVQITSESRTLSETGSPTVVGRSVVGSIAPPTPPSPPPKEYKGYAYGTLPDGTRALIGQFEGNTTAAGPSRVRPMLWNPGLDRALADGYSKSSIQAFLNSSSANGMEVSRSVLAQYGLTPGPGNIVVP